MNWILPGKKTLISSVVSRKYPELLVLNYTSRRGKITNVFKNNSVYIYESYYWPSGL